MVELLREQDPEVGYREYVRELLRFEQISDATPGLPELTEELLILGNSLMQQYATHDEFGELRSSRREFHSPAHPTELLLPARDIGLKAHEVAPDEFSVDDVLAAMTTLGLHDVFQDRDTGSTYKDTQIQQMRYHSGWNELYSAEVAVEAIESKASDLGVEVPAEFTQKVALATLATQPRFVEGEQCQVKTSLDLIQPVIQTTDMNNMNVVALVALLDIGAHGVLEPEVFLAHGRRMVLEYNPIFSDPNLADRVRKQKQPEDEEMLQVLREKYLGQQKFVQYRKDQLPNEIERFFTTGLVETMKKELLRYTFDSLKEARGIATLASVLDLHELIEYTQRDSLKTVS